MIPLAVIRPEPGCAATVAAASALGLDAHGFPLFKVRAMAWSAPGAAEFDALLAGSGNVFRHGGPAMAAYRHLPVYAVGKSTAREARSAGFVETISGNGGLQAMLGRLAPEHRRLLRLAGRERVPLTTPPGVTIDEQIVYESAPLALPAGLVSMLRRPCVVLLHSGEAARHFARQCEAEGIWRSRIVLAALGPRIAGSAGNGWRGVHCAREPNDKALLALARHLCQTATSS